MKSKLFLYVSLAVDILIAISKFIAAIVTGSAAMTSEGVHSVIDAVSQLLLIWGVKLSGKSPDAGRPFGYGKELYFWSFIVSLMIFLVGGCISIYEGLIQLRHPRLDGNEGWNYGILIFAMIFNSVSLYFALQAFNKERGKTPFWAAIKLSKDPSTFIVLLGDVGDILGLAVAFCGVFLGHVYHKPYYDAIASILIGIILLAISMLLVRESKSLLMGESGSIKTMRKIVILTQTDPAVIKVKKHFSTYLAPEEILLQLNTVFKADLTTVQITDAIERITKAIQAEFPRFKQIFIEPVRR